VQNLWKFERFEFSVACGLTHDGVAVPIQAKPRKLLKLLLCASGQVVLKDTIAVALWGETSPSDASIARAVSGLRKVLAIGGNDMVRTVYGEGVQLSCSVNVVFPKTASDQDAITALLQTARELVSDRKPDSHARAMNTLRYTVARYPDAALAWSSMADLYASMTVRGLLGPTEASAKINQCCESALRADPNCFQALAVSGWALAVLIGRQDEGERRLEAARSVGSNWLTFFYCAWLKLKKRDLSGALAELEQGLVYNPLDRSLLSTRAFFTLYQGKFEEADALARDGQKVRSDIDGLWLVRSIVASESGDFARGCRYAERAASLLGSDRKTLAYLAYAYAMAGDADRARTLMGGIGPGVNGHTPAFLAATYLALGDTAEAVGIVQIANVERCPNLAAIWCDPRLQAIWHLI
jgi:DNA-binding winged helix-turn-helix (wHTH) protein